MGRSPGRGSVDFAGGVVAFVPNAIDEEVDHLLGRHLAEVILEADDDAGTAVHPPEEHSDAVLWRFSVVHVPELHLPERAQPSTKKGVVNVPR